MPIPCTSSSRSARAQPAAVDGAQLGLSPAELGLRLMDDGDFEIDALGQQGL
ncbi:hypothetical protein [Massilia sp. BSC265]|uniref:hypothetical protein n=1 Tax=Massilia sp. BSC265 TaxID=1549812 RepID=UPI000B3343C4|nr:hypothetical protein [Massilia sp. BSC265]